MVNRIRYLLYPELKKKSIDFPVGMANIHLKTKQAAYRHKPGRCGHSSPSVTPERKYISAPE
jgi:hypothetical protein